MFQASFLWLVILKILFTWEKLEVPAMLSEIIGFVFENEPKGFPELGWNPSTHLGLSNNNNSLTCNNNEHLDTVLLS